MEPKEYKSSSKLHMICVSANNDIHTSLHFTALHFTCRYFTSSHLTFTELHFTALLFC